jgi:hypothetical protein
LSIYCGNAAFACLGKNPESKYLISRMLSDEKFQKEFSLEQCRKKFPELNHLSDEELIEARDEIYELAKLTIKLWRKKCGSNKILFGN